MKVLIIEDEELAAKRLSQMLRKEVPEIEIHGPIDTVKNAISHLRDARDYDLIFLDIQLADGRSFSIFEQVRIQTPVIFTTAYDEFAVKAFELNSVDYLLKPIQQIKLKASLEKFRKLREMFSRDSSNQFLNELMSTLRSQPVAIYQNRFLVSKGDSMIPVNVNEIAYFFAEDKVVFLVRNDGTRFIIPYSLEDLETKLDPATFFRVNRQYIVSVPSIRKVHHHFNYKLKIELTPLAEEDVIVSKSRTNEFKAWMNR